MSTVEQILQSFICVTRKKKVPALQGVTNDKVNIGSTKWMEEQLFQQMEFQ